MSARPPSRRGDSIFLVPLEAAARAEAAPHKEDDEAGYGGSYDVACVEEAAVIGVGAAEFLLVIS